MPHPFSCEALPVVLRGFALRQRNLHLPLLFSDIFRNMITRLELPIGIEIGGDVDPLLLQSEQQVVQFVELCRILGDSVRRGRVGQPRVMMMNPDRIATTAGEVVRKTVRLLFRRKVCRETEVRTIEANAFFRRERRGEMKSRAGCRFIFVDGGTTTAHLGMLLRDSRMRIVADSLAINDISLRNCGGDSGPGVILTGGHVNRKSSILIGPEFLRGSSRQESRKPGERTVAAVAVGKRQKKAENSSVPAGNHGNT